MNCRSPIGEVSPPTHTRKQNLPIEELSWESFERLCLQLARREVDVESCRPYGVQGDKQEGIDIFARDGHRQSHGAKAPSGLSTSGARYRWNRLWFRLRVR